MALAAYRNLMRAARIAFEGDARMLAAAKHKIRHEFREKSSLVASGPDSQVVAAIEHAQQVAQFMRRNVVQGRKVEGREGDESTYKLRIHEHIERGDNESINMAGPGTKFGGCGCT